MLAAAGDFYRDRIEDQLISGEGHVICAKSSSRIRVGIASSTQGNDKLQVRMAAVKQQVLNWLYSVLTSEYKDVNRTYNDVAQTLSHYPTLSPRTEVYTYENGKSALLLQLSGTLPVVFRGTTYRFPITLWAPHRYPLEAPLVYVTPVGGMIIRPGQHVDPQGRIYHPYLVGWAEYWDRSTILDFLAILRDIFAIEPPVISQQQQNAPPHQHAAPTPPPVPPLPPNIGRPASTASNIMVNTSANTSAQPPPPPPKPGTNLAARPQSPAGLSRPDNGPPLPPLPSQHAREGSRYAPQIQQPPPNSQYTPQRVSTLRYESAPPLPPQPTRQQSLRDPSYSPVSPITPENPYQRAQYTQSYQQSSPSNQIPQYQAQQARPPTYIPQQSQYSNQPPQWQQNPPQPQPQPPPQQKPPPPPDLLDAPLVLSIPSEASTNLPAPPIPPNPEKDMLLHNLGQALQSQRSHTLKQTTGSLPGLEAQHNAMLTALNSMQAEIQALESLNNLLTNNTNILHTALHDADAMIDSSQHRTAPNVDELLVAPTVVANQLYELVSEERSLGDALFILGRAVEKGRIEPQVFTKMTRSLAREWFLKKALVKKIGKGMGLATY